MYEVSDPDTPFVLHWIRPPSDTQISQRRVPPGPATGSQKRNREKADDTDRRNALFPRRTTCCNIMITF